MTQSCLNRHLRLSISLLSSPLWHNFVFFLGRNKLFVRGQTSLQVVYVAQSIVGNNGLKTADFLGVLVLNSSMSR